MLQGLLVKKELKLELVVEAAALFEAAADVLKDADVGACGAPETDAEMFFAHGQNYTVQLLHFFRVDRATDHGDKRLYPALTALLLHVFLDRECDDPLAAIAIAWVFPLRPNALLEHHVVRVGHDFLD